MIKFMTCTYTNKKRCISSRFETSHSDRATLNCSHKALQAAFSSNKQRSLHTTPSELLNDHVIPQQNHG